MRQPDGATKRDHLESVERQTGKRPAALDGPEFPVWGRHLFDAWLELNTGRGSNGFGPNPISWPDLAAWAALTARDVTPFEARVIMQIDRAWLQEQAKAPPPPKPPPASAPTKPPRRTRQ